MIFQDSLVVPSVVFKADGYLTSLSKNSFELDAGCYIMPASIFSGSETFLRSRRYVDLLRSSYRMERGYVFAKIS